MKRLHCSPQGTGSGFTADQPGNLYDALDLVAATGAERNEPIDVILQNGTYELGKPIRLTPEHSGRMGYPVRIIAAEPGKALLSGGRKLAGWQPVERHPLGAWKAFASPGRTIRQLYVNGVRASRAAWTQLPAMERTEWGYTATGDAFAGLQSAAMLEFVFEQQWTQCRIGVERVEDDGRQIVMKQPAFKMALEKRGVSIDLPVRIEGIVEALRQPGDWAYDQDGGWLYYVPLPGEDMLQADTVVPVLETLLVGEGTPDNPLTDIELSGLHFSHATWLRPNADEGYAEVQAMFCATPDNPGAADSDKDHKPEAHVRFHAARRVRVEGNTFAQLGGVAMSMDGGSQDNEIVGNAFYDLSGTAIQLGGITPMDHSPGRMEDMTRGNAVRHNRIRHIGLEYAGAVGIWCGYTSDTVISHNDLSDLPYSAISIGWGWGNRDHAPCTRNNRITNNRIANVMNVLWDGGGIYSLAAQPNQLIADNVVSGVRNREAAIYLDNKSRYNTVQRNVLWDNHPGKHMHFNDNVGDIVVRWNVMDDSTEMDHKACIRYSGNQVVPAAAAPASIVAQSGILEPYRTRLGMSGEEGDVPALPAPARVKCVDRGSDWFELAWDRSGASAADHSYEVIVNGQFAAVTTALSCVVEGLEPNTLFKVEVQAQDGEGRKSEAVEAATIRTLPDVAENPDAAARLEHISIRLNAGAAVLTPGLSCAAELVGYYEDGGVRSLQAEDGALLRWTSDHPPTAAIDDAGRITIHATGTCEVTAQFKDSRGYLHTAVKKLLIQPVSVSGLAWNLSNTTLFVSESGAVALTWQPILNNGRMASAEGWQTRVVVDGEAISVDEESAGTLRIQALRPGHSELLLEVSDPSARLSYSAKKRVCVLPEGWQAAIIGPDYGEYAVDMTSSGSLRIRSRGEDIWGVEDECLFVYKDLEWSAASEAVLELEAEIGSLDDTHPSTMAGVMLRLGLEADAPNLMFRIHAEPGKPRKFSPITYRLEQGSATRFRDPGSLALPARIRLTAHGDEISLWMSDSQGDWELREVVPFPGLAKQGRLQAGIAHCSHERKRTAEALVQGVIAKIR